MQINGWWTWMSQWLEDDVGDISLWTITTSFLPLSNTRTGRHLEASRLLWFIYVATALCVLLFEVPVISLPVKSRRLQPRRLIRLISSAEGKHNIQVCVCPQVSYKVLKRWGKIGRSESKDYGKCKGEEERGDGPLHECRPLFHACVAAC